ncbi:thioredoxin domain-containing protein [Pelosinus sp. IPA-1]|uniref:thioredoxin domain-containing protein n=1 Tax=Pelosinus sp. IPA-1 TaxID=3029569 RepID=UPI00243620EC|nr:thioredoxin domain-containing protein [Pelosinus sp. IPA-1]GMA97774.1 thioredoxin domain-containing protein [Pelosinus sp. IPA-1]
MDKKANRLINEKSPYLLQHAYNPVDWYPWGQEAFEKASRENKTIFLSVGYSSCHWCHVMERECFEDQEVADVLNDHFVSIKVDREERPDVDGIYMSVCQALTGQGGWPLTIIMDPDKKPFFAGTYFPKHRKMGRMGLLELLTVVHKKWQENREEILEASNQIVNILQRPNQPNEKGQIGTDLLEQAYLELENSFDPKYGGFGTAPKFPTPHKMNFLLRYWRHFKKDKALSMVEKTLLSMWQGGIYDHLGYGFARYSTDQKWLVPHFEKMLYDNALLCDSYLEAYQCTGNQEFARIVEEILTYVMRDMMNEKGGFFSAEDADSEGVEGKFYVFTRKEIMNIVGEEAGTIFADFYEISSQGNFEHGTSILHVIGRDFEAFASSVNKTVTELADLLQRGREKIYQVREKRIHPYKDDKILTAWNALMIASFAKASRILERDNYSMVAERAIEFIFDNLVRADGRLLARYRDGDSAHLAYLDDYAFLLLALLETYQTTYKDTYLQRAIKIADDMKALFGDEKKGGFFFYGVDGEELITRPKEIYDGAIPSGNSVAALALQKLADITENEDVRKMAEKLLDSFAGEVSRYAAGYTYFMMAVDYYLAEKIKVVIVGDKDLPDTKAMLQAMNHVFLPTATVRFYDIYSQNTSNYKGTEGRATAYLCKGVACQPPITDVEIFRTKLLHNN